MKECCKNCELKAYIEKWDYKSDSVLKKENMPFYVCTMFWETEKEKLIYMYNTDEGEGMCEMFTPIKYE